MAAPVQRTPTLSILTQSQHWRYELQYGCHLVLSRAMPCHHVRAQACRSVSHTHHNP